MPKIIHSKESLFAFFEKNGNFVKKIPFMKQVFFVLLNFILFFSFTACEDCVFTSKNTTSASIRFYEQKLRAGKLVYDTLPIQFSALTTNVKNLPLFSRLNSRSTYLLRINPSADTSTFYFRRLVEGKTRFDTLTIAYKRQISLVSPDCGYDEAITELKIKHQTFAFDSLAIPKPELTIENVPNIQFFKKL